MDGVVAAYYEIKKTFPLFMQLFRWVQKEGFNETEISDLLEKQYSTNDLDKMCKLEEF